MIKSLIRNGLLSLAGHYLALPSQAVQSGLTVWHFSLLGSPSTSHRRCSTAHFKLKYAALLVQHCSLLASSAFAAAAMEALDVTTMSGDSEPLPADPSVVEADTSNPSDTLAQLLIFGIPLLQLIGYFGSAASFGIMFSQLKQFLTILSAGTAKGVSPLPTVSMLVNYVGWAMYGSCIGDAIVALPAGIGILLGLFYYFVLITHLPGEKKPQLFRLTLYAALALLALVSPTFIPNHDPCGFLGLGCCVANVLLYGSPLAKLVRPLHALGFCTVFHGGQQREVMETKRTEEVSVAQSAAAFTASFLWSIYGLLAGE